MLVYRFPLRFSLAYRRRLTLVALLAIAATALAILARPVTAEDERWAELQLGPGPGGRWGSASAYDPIRHRLLVFGGQSNAGNLNDLWSLSLDPGGETWTELQPAGTKPKATYGYHAVFDEAGDRMILYEGEQGAVWILDFPDDNGMWRKLSMAPKPPVGAGASFVYQLAVLPEGTVRRAILFGGEPRSGGKYLNETWSLNLEPGAEGWSRIRTCGTGPIPTGRQFHAAVYDGARHRMLVYGGSTTSGATERDVVWALELTPGAECWSRLMPAGGGAIEPRVMPSVVLDPCAGAQQALYFGGEAQSGFLNDLIRLTLSSSGLETLMRLEPAGLKPRPRSGNVAVLDPANRRMVIALGSESRAGGGVFLSDTWSFQLAPCAAPAPSATAQLTDPPSATPTTTATTEPVSPTPPEPSPTATTAAATLPPPSATPVVVPPAKLYMPALQRSLESSAM